jgi:hypothetical protein
MQTPQKENGQKKAETRTKQKISLTNAASWTLLGMGAATLVTSIVYVSSILAFIGLSLTFWGALLLYAKTQEYTSELLDASMLSSLYTFNQLIQELNYKGKLVYLPPKYFENPETVKIYISKQKKTDLPKPEETQKQKNNLFVKNHQGILLTPPGAELTKLFESTLETNFTKVNLKYLQQNLPKLFVEDLEIAENLEFQTKEDTIHLKITNLIYKDSTNLSHGFNKIGCPVCSAIACAITKATGNPVMIEKTEVSEDGTTTELIFRLLGMQLPVPTDSTEKMEFLTQTQLEKPVKFHPRKLIDPHLASIALTGSGSVILALIGWLIWNDITVWGKDIAFIFFGYRTGEAITLGIGMQVIHYFLIGLALFLSGLIIFLGKKLGEKQE